MLIEFTAEHPDGGCCRHRGAREAVERIAAELRAEGYAVAWRPLPSVDYPAWNWHHPAPRFAR